MARKTIHLRIGELLDKQGVSTAELVEKTGVAYNTALGLRRGAVARIDLDVLARICEALAVEPGELFELVDTFDKKSGK
jgi:DNA-binding Xre family transcriptional regulator